MVIVWVRQVSNPTAGHGMMADGQVGQVDWGSDSIALDQGVHLSIVGFPMLHLCCVSTELGGIPLEHCFRVELKFECVAMCG